MKKGTIIKNLWAGYPTYFVFIGERNGRKGEARFAYGWGIVLFNGRWNLSRAEYYTHDLKSDKEHFQIVGSVDIESAIITSILNNIPMGMIADDVSRVQKDESPTVIEASE